MTRIPFTKWYKDHGLKRRDAYRWLEENKNKATKELRDIVQKRKMWVLCIDERVKP